jgi:hypothetical protein
MMQNQLEIPHSELVRQIAWHVRRGRGVRGRGGGRQRVPVPLVLAGISRTGEHFTGSGGD